MNDPDDELADFLSDLRNAESNADEEALGQGRLASLLRSPKILDAVLKLAKRDNRLRRCLASARYYSGLSAVTCERIDAVLQVPFQGAAGPRKR